MSENSKKKFYALNMFDVTDVEKYVAYFSRLPEVAPQYGGRMVAFGRFRDNVAGDLAPRQVLFLVEWESEEAFNTFRDDPELVDFHPLRENGTASYIWQTFDGLDMVTPPTFRSTTCWRCSSLKPRGTASRTATSRQKPTSRCPSGSEPGQGCETG